MVLPQDWEKAGPVVLDECEGWKELWVDKGKPEVKKWFTNLDKGIQQKESKGKTSTKRKRKGKDESKQIYDLYGDTAGRVVRNNKNKVCARRHHTIILYYINNKKWLCLNIIIVLLLSI